MEPGKIIKGSLSTIILQLLENNGPMYGYEMTKAVKEGSGDKMKITEAALYPALHKLEQDGLLDTESKVIDGRVRKYYQLTKMGKKEGKKQLASITEMMISLQKILNHRLQNG